ncbi:MAG: HAMP domain-containing histidine kinase [Acidobacteria bacterium]|nr:HAMP domain-containing histidine kinase [Acidobacteriota bacterium]
MNLENIRARAFLSWATVGVMAVLCLVLAALQYVWIGEVSRGERKRLEEGLKSSVQRLAQDFNDEVSNTFAALRPPVPSIDELGREQAYAERTNRWRESAAYPEIVKRVGLAVPKGEELKLVLFDTTQETFAPAEWPRDWDELREGLLQRLTERRGGPMQVSRATIFEMPRFGRRESGPGPGVEQEWLLVEFDEAYLRSTYLPMLIARHIGTGTPAQVRVFDRQDPSRVIFHSNDTSEFKADASASLLESMRFGFGPPPDGGRGKQRWKIGPPPMQPPDFNRGRWQLDVRYAEGSLDAIVARIRWRNLGISAAILALMLGTAVLLVRFSRQQQKLAELQMNFVASVSHELRTPLTVIRTAAFNLRGRVAANPAQVERYGSLIQDESEKLTALVEQVLRFSSARAGHAVGEKSPVAIEGVIEEGLHSRRLGGAGSRIVVEKNLEDGLPLVMADELALRHAIQNLLDNAVKYGTENSEWIGVAAKKVTDLKGDAVEIRISDHGPGIPKEEQADIFNPFFRGRRAQQDQIHGTGLGLNLVKRIVEAHEGTIRVESEPGQGTEFILRIPAAPAELQDEFAHTSG